MAALEARGGDAHNGIGPKGASGGDAVPPQLEPTEGLPERKAAAPPAGAGRPDAARVRPGRPRRRSARRCPRTCWPRPTPARTEPTRGRRRPALGPGAPTPARAAPSTSRPTPAARWHVGEARNDGHRQAEGPRAVRRQVLAHAAAARPAATCSPSRWTPCAALPRRPFQLREFVQQTWFIASVTILPTALVAIPFGAVIALQLGSLTRQLGAQSFTGVGRRCWRSLREASPIVTALLIAGAGGSAICADLGARKIRDEIDAMEVLGISPIQRLVVPAGARLHARRRPAQRPGQRRRRRRRLLLQRHPAGRHPGRLPGLVQRAGAGAGLLVRGDQGADLRRSSPRSWPPTRACAPAAARRASATR